MFVLLYMISLPLVVNWRLSLTEPQCSGLIV